MKKILTLLLVVSTMFGLVGCTNVENPQTTKVKIGVSWSMDAKAAEEDEDVNAYLSAIEEAGAEAVYLDQVVDEESALKVLSTVDGIIMAGGEDINPALYGEEPSELCEEWNEVRDTSDFYLLKAAIAEDKPVVATCRGMQMLNTIQGGTLYQDLFSEYDTDINHRDPELIDFTYHNVTVDDNNIIADALGGAGTYKVNSWHHQGIDQVGEGLEVVARADDGMVEGIILKDAKYIYGVQFHPEWHVVDGTLDCLSVFEALIDATAK